MLIVFVCRFDSSSFLDSRWSLLHRDIEEALGNSDATARFSSEGLVFLEVFLKVIREGRPE